MQEIPDELNTNASSHFPKRDMRKRFPDNLGKSEWTCTVPLSFGGNDLSMSSETAILLPLKGTHRDICLPFQHLWTTETDRGSLENPFSASQYLVYK